MAISSTLDKTAAGVLIAILILMPLVSHAGGLGVAPLVFILGLMGLVLHLKSDDRKIPRSPVFWFLSVFLLWICISSFWSPYQSSGVLTNYMKLLIIGLVLFFSLGVFRHVADTKRLVMQRIFIITTFLSAVMVAIDVGTGFKITLFFNPAPSHEALQFRLIDAEKNLGHAITVLVLLSVPIILMLKESYKSWKVLSAIYCGLILIASVQNYLWIGGIGIVGAILTLIVAHKFPHKTLIAVIGLAVASIIFAPLLAFFSSVYSQGDLSHIPGSWEHRLRMWAYCWPVILDNPIIGAGFDAVRTYDDQWRARNGLDLSIVSLHPHNAGIHIWTETGIIGCFLAVSSILAAFETVKKYTVTADRAVLISGVIIPVVLISSLSLSLIHI